MKNIILVIFITLTVFGCKTKWINVQFESNSNTTLYYYSSLSSQLVSYPDTSFSAIADQLRVLPPHSVDIIDVFKEILPPFDTVSCFVFSIDTLLEYHWIDIKRDYNVLVRYDLSREDLLRLNYTIPYPPTEVMKNMKMWPRYKDVTH